MCCISVLFFVHTIESRSGFPTRPSQEIRIVYIRLNKSRETWSHLPFYDKTNHGTGKSEAEVTNVMWVTTGRNGDETSNNTMPSCNWNWAIHVNHTVRFVSPNIMPIRRLNSIISGQFIGRNLFVLFRFLVGYHSCNSVESNMTCWLWVTVPLYRER